MARKGLEKNNDLQFSYLLSFEGNPKKILRGPFYLTKPQTIFHQRGINQSSLLKERGTLFTIFTIFYIVCVLKNNNRARKQKLNQIYH